MKDIPFRECNQCEYIEHCSHPFVEDDGSAHPPSECPKPDKIKLYPRVKDTLPHEYFIDGNT